MWRAGCECFCGADHTRIADPEAAGHSGGAAQMAASSSAASSRSASAARAPATRTSAARVPGRSSFQPSSNTAHQRAHPGAGARVGSSSSQSAALEQARRELEEMRLQEENIVKEREFYFNKLRDVEVQVGERLALIEELLAGDAGADGKKAAEEEKEFLLDIQAVLYSTEVRGATCKRASALADGAPRRTGRLRAPCSGRGRGG